MADRMRRAATGCQSPKHQTPGQQPQGYRQTCTPAHSSQARPPIARRLLAGLALVLLTLLVGLALFGPSSEALAAEKKCMLHQALKGKCKLGENAPGAKSAKKSGAKKSSKKSAKKTAAPEEKQPEPEPEPAWVFTDLAKSGPNDVFYLPDHATMQQWHKDSIASDPYRNPYKRKRSEIPSYPQRPWNNRLPFFKDPSMGVVTSDFGWRNLNGLDFHGGFDIKAPIRTPVYTHVSGEIIKIFHGRGTNVGIILQTDDVQHLFWHMTPVRALSKGDRIEAGQLIGKLAPWGYQTHLHYAIFVVGPTGTDAKRDDKNAIDPMYVLERLQERQAPPKVANSWFRRQQLPYAQQLPSGDGGEAEKTSDPSYGDPSADDASEGSGSEGSRSPDQPELIARWGTDLP